MGLSSVFDKISSRNSNRIHPKKTAKDSPGIQKSPPILKLRFAALLILFFTKILAF
jgi:hypothetical protein